MKKITIYIITGMLLFGNYSCDKQLSALPDNAKVDATTVVDQQSAKTTLNGVYYKLANINASSNITQWLSHSVIPSMLSGYMGYGYGSMPEESNNIASIGFDAGWADSYSVINAANAVIKGVNLLGDNMFTGNTKKEILGESHFLRAYGHYRLLVYFSEWFDVNSKNGVLIRNELSTLGNAAKARSNVADSYKFILEDLEYAIANAPAANKSHYATKWAAMALKMKVLMCRGAQSDFTEIKTLADNIINTGPYLLENNIKDLFHAKGLASKEVILGIMPQADQESYYYILSRQFYPGASSLYVAKKSFKDLFVNDPRGTWMVGPATPYQAYSPNTFYFTKFIPMSTSPTQTSETSYILRLSEVYLLKAEAIVRSGGSLTDAGNILKNIMSKGGVSDFAAIDNATTNQAMLLQIYYETVRSLMGEDGADWNALLRLPFETVKQVRPTITSKFQYLFPIPASEFKTNPLFGDQNPGYQKQ